MSWDEFAARHGGGVSARGFPGDPSRGGRADFELVQGARHTLVAGKRWKATRTGIEPLRELEAARARRTRRTSASTSRSGRSRSRRGRSRWRRRSGSCREPTWCCCSARETPRTKQADLSELVHTPAVGRLATMTFHDKRREPFWRGCADIAGMILWPILRDEPSRAAADPAVDIRADEVGERAVAARRGIPP